MSKLVEPKAFLMLIIGLVMDQEARNLWLACQIGELLD